MEYLHMNNTSQDDSNTTANAYGYNGEAGLSIKVGTYIIISIGLPLTLVAICALYSLVRKDHVAPIYVINLLFSDLIQLCCIVVEVVRPKNFTIYIIFFHIYIYCLLTSVGFMVCIALERYLVIAWPLWYHFRRTIKISVLVCVVVWAYPLICLLSFLFWHYKVAEIISIIFFLLPLPLLIFFLGGTLRALSASISVPSEEKRRIVGMLVLVLLIYTLLFLPTVILYLAEGLSIYDTLNSLFPVFLRLSPLADLVLYIFMKKGTIDKLLASVCCCRMDNNEISSLAI